MNHCVLYFTGLWGLINNAGISGRSGVVEWLNLDDYHKVTGVNLFGLIDVTMTFLPLIKKEKGRIVNTGKLNVILEQNKGYQ